MKVFNMIIQYIVEHVEPLDGTILLNAFENEAGALAFAAQENIKGGTIYPLRTYENKGHPFVTTQYPRYQKEGDHNIDTYVPFSDEQVQNMYATKENDARARLYAANDPLVLPVLRAQIAALPEQERGEYVILWEIMAAMPSEYKGAEIAKLYKALAVLPEKSKTDEFKELERRRAEIRAQTAIDVTAMIGGE